MIIILLGSTQEIGFGFVPIVLGVEMRNISYYYIHTLLKISYFGLLIVNWSLTDPSLE